MSVHVLSRFLEESRSELGARLVGISMSHAAWGDGICWADQKRIMHETRLSESSVRRAVRELERLGEIETRKAQRGRRRINVYRLWCAEPPDYERLPFELDEPFSATTGQNDRRSSETLRPVILSDDDRSDATTTPLTERKRERKDSGARWQVNRKYVTDDEQALAEAVLAAWNARAGQTLASREWLAMIIGRVREHPSLELGDHERLIDAVLARPWWQGAPAPNLIYGSGAQFERSIIAAVAPDTSAAIEEERARFARIRGGA